MGQHDPARFGGQYGYYTDTETGLLCLTHRYYDPGAGRFLTRDPLGYAGGANLYGFCGGNPVNGMDPDGTQMPGSTIEGSRPMEPPTVPKLPVSTPDLKTLQPVLVRAAKWGGRLLIGPVGMTVGLFFMSAKGTADDSMGPGSPYYRMHTPPVKRGPKPKGTGPHNAKIAERIEQLKKAHPDWVHERGGDITEETILTPGGFKSTRRPDITFRRPDGTLYRENVGKTESNGSPVLRERRALDDLQGATGTRPTFTPYDR